MCQNFENVSLETLGAADADTLNAFPFGIIGFGPDAIVTVYNDVESTSAGLKPKSVLERHFFAEVAPCMNNFMVAQRFEDEPQLDVIIPYVLTLRMRPTPVRLRLLKAPDNGSRFILVDRKVST